MDTLLGQPKNVIVECVAKPAITQGQNLLIKNDIMMMNKHFHSGRIVRGNVYQNTV